MLAFAVVLRSVCCAALLLLPGVPTHTTATPVTSAAPVGAGPTGAAAHESPLLTFAVISDLHVTGWEPASHGRFAAVLRDLHEQTPAVNRLIIVGDLGDGRAADYQAVRAVLTAYPHPPVAVTIGNHEFYGAFYNAGGAWSPATFPNGETDSQALRRFTAFAGRTQVYGDAYSQGYHFLYLGAETSRMTDPRYADRAHLSAAQLDWLGQRLAVDSGQRPVFVFLHQPLAGALARSHDQDGVVEESALRSILARRPGVILFSGHTHRTLGPGAVVVKDGLTLVNTGAVAYVLDEHGRRVPGKSEGLIVAVYPDKVVIRGRDFQARTWVPNATFTVKLALGVDESLRLHSQCQPFAMKVRSH